jgi:hypothetical protein
MEIFQHKPIKRFGLDGIINDDSAIYRLQQEYIRLLVSEMRLSGYAPRFDIDPQFTLSYNETKNYFEFTLSVYGIYVGRKKAEWILGIDGVRPIYIQPVKSREYSRDLA